MYGVINLILNKIGMYNGFLDFYTKEFSTSLSIINVLNFTILVLILFFIFLQFLVKIFGFWNLFLFILKRFLFSLFIFLFFYLSSDFTICETPINKNLGNILNTDKKKYFCIAGLTISGCYVGYKYIPVLYSTLKSYTKYKDCLIKKQEFDGKMTSYLNYVSKKKDINSEVLLNSSLTIKFNEIGNIYKENILFFISEFLSILPKYNFLQNNCREINLLLLRFNPKNNLEYKFNVLFLKYELISKEIKTLQLSNNVYNLSEDFILNQKLLFKSLNKLIYTYEIECLQLFIISKNHELLIEGQILSEKVNLLLNETIIICDKLLESKNLVNSIDFLVVPPIDYIPMKLISVKKPKLVDTIEFPIELLSGFKFIG